MQYKNLTIKECMESSDDEMASYNIKKAQRWHAKLKKLRKVVRKSKGKIKRLQQNIRIKKNKITKLKLLLKDMKNKNLIHEEVSDKLEEIAGANIRIFERQLLKSKGRSLPKSYDPKTREFALNLNFLSPNAYKYVRAHFSNCLPHPRTLGRWYENIDCKPGFTKQSFLAIKKACEEAKNKNKKIYLNIVYDEIDIRKQIDWDGKNSYGYVDVGDGNGTGEIATQILVFMAVCINRLWKISLGFFPITSLSAKQKENLISVCYEHILQTGAEIMGLTFDGASANITAAKLLGCDLKNIHDRSYFNLNGSSEQYVVHLDPCHMMKLVRNALADLRTFFDSSGKRIEWTYLEKLIHLQEREGLHLGNKIRKAHIYFAQQKMKVKLAVQLLSKSVADALDFCREVLHFQNLLEASL